MARNAYAKWIDINGVPFIISSSVLIRIYSSILIQLENLKRKLGHAMKGQSFSEAMNLWKLWFSMVALCLNCFEVLLRDSRNLAILEMILFLQCVVRCILFKKSVANRASTCAQKLDQAVETEKADRFWDTKFKKGVLRAPRLLIHDGTESLFLNRIALEQCHIDCGNEITSDADVADLFNQLCQEVVSDINDSYLSRLSEDVNQHYNHKWNTWRASLKHNYFSNPWAIVSLFAAVVLLLLVTDLLRSLCL
ncbi:hypothetical protein POTOM_021390 [Populus tomentosa]|uniref:Uncharacterized protein n=1 Tax=Populus tomentosa TaxID=118781 RepID=A0A8X7ZRT4_POPTO|nr:hypothetical protein POTOM_021390 [Populus tomentosa]